MQKQLDTLSHLVAEAGLRELISADARLQVADRFAGRLIDSPYFGNYQRWKTPWRNRENRAAEWRGLGPRDLVGSLLRYSAGDAKNRKLKA